VACPADTESSFISANKLAPVLPKPNIPEAATPAGLVVNALAKAPISANAPAILALSAVENPSDSGLSAASCCSIVRPLAVALFCNCSC